MKFASLVGFGVHALLAARTAYCDESASERQSPALQACAQLKSSLPDQVFYPGSPRYTYENQRYWSATDYSSPACVFSPESSQEVSLFVRTVTRFNARFALRGGGHMPIPGSNNIDNSGLLLSPSNLTQLELSPNKKSVSIGPGRRWNEVYDYLTPFGLATLGGRVGKVGAPGFLLGGGISFYSNQYGFASDNIEEYECVLADGRIARVTADNDNSDLFWALKGGGNSFCLVTRFDIKTVVSPTVWVGIATYLFTGKDQYLDAVYGFGKYGSQDAKAAIIPTIVLQPLTNLTIYSAAKFYDGDNANPPAFQNFTPPVLNPVIDDYSKRPLNQYIAQTDALQPDGLRQLFQTLSFVVDRATIGLIHDSFVYEVSNKLGRTSLTQASLTFQPITKQFIQQGIKKGGNPQGIDPNKAPYFWVVMDYGWLNAGDDALINKVAKDLTNRLISQLEAKGLSGGYLYMNDAGPGQSVFQNYPPANLARLKRIRAKYDPGKVFTRLLPGGWKVDAA